MLLYHFFVPVLLVIFFVVVDSRSNSKLHKSYPAVPGGVPVFIRSGDTPLKDIDQDLADAFEFNAQKHGRLAFGRPLNKVLEDKKKLSDENSISDDNFVDTDVQSGLTHIQKIPKH